MKTIEEIVNEKFGDDLSGYFYVTPNDFVSFYKEAYNKAISDVVSMSAEEDVIAYYQSTVDGVLNIPIYESRYFIGKKRLLKLKK